MFSCWLWILHIDSRSLWRAWRNLRIFSGKNLAVDLVPVQRNLFPVNQHFHCRNITIGLLRSSIQCWRYVFCWVVRNVVHNEFLLSYYLCHDFQLCWFVGSLLEGFFSLDYISILINLRENLPKGCTLEDTTSISTSNTVSHCRCSVYVMW